MKEIGDNMAKMSDVLNNKVIPVVMKFVNTRPITAMKNGMLYPIPFIIVENGIGDYDTIEEDGSIHDENRINYLCEHVREVEKAVVLDGINVIGYLSWGPIDIVSAGTGEMKKRYGYVYVDLDDEGKGSGARLKKDSFYWYKKVISSGGKMLS